jgi:F-type H+-transporting ATPase subunit alpha
MTASAGILQPALERAFARLHRGRDDFAAELTLHEVGVVTKVSTGIATFSGLPSVGYEEIVSVPRRSAWHRIQPR